MVETAARASALNFILCGDMFCVVAIIEILIIITIIIITSDGGMTFVVIIWWVGVARMNSSRELWP